MPLIEDLKKRVHHLRRDTFALYLAARHPDTPWYAKVLVAGIVAYAFSPIDLIPDFIPILGYLDDLVLIPLGIAVAIKMIPAEVLAECRSRAQASLAGGKPVSRIAAVVIAGIWILLAALCVRWAYQVFSGTARDVASNHCMQPTPPPVIRFACADLSLSGARLMLVVRRLAPWSNATNQSEWNTWN